MLTDIQYCTDAKGNKIAVIVPVEEWEKITARYKILQDKMRIFTGIQEAVKEVKTARQNGEELPTLTDFINENRD